MATKLYSTEDRNESHQLLATYLVLNPGSSACCRDNHPYYEVWDGPPDPYVAPPPPPAPVPGQITLNPADLQTIVNAVVAQIQGGA